MYFEKEGTGAEEYSTQETTQIWALAQKTAGQLVDVVD